MKKSGIVAATVAAASATSATTTASSSSAFTFTAKIPHRQEGKERDNSSEKFAPRFDGLRFIETLVTAHR